MQARYYDPVIGRFYSNDPIGYTNIHTFNRYAYANNNPYRYTDPDGKATSDIQQLRNQGFSSDLGSFHSAQTETLKTVAIEGATLAIGGGVAGLAVKGLVKVTTSITAKISKEAVSQVLVAAIELGSIELGVTGNVPSDVDGQLNGDRQRIEKGSKNMSNKTKKKTKDKHNPKLIKKMIPKKIRKLL